LEREVQGFADAATFTRSDRAVLLEDGGHATIRRLLEPYSPTLEGAFMFSRSKNVFFYAAAAIFFTAGLACDKFGNKSGISNSEIVAVVGDHNITFGDWMKQMDLLRVFASSIDPDNTEQVKAVLDSLIDQQLVLDAAQKARFSDPSFDESLKKKLLESELKIKEIREKLEKDIQTVQRIQKGYQEPYKKMLLAREFASSQVSNVVVTEKDMRDWYDQYAAQAKRAGQKLPPYEKVKKEVKPSVQAEKFLKSLQEGSKVDRKQDTIKKYLDTLSVSSQMLDAKNNLPTSTDAKGADKK
jgi:hypothetical protein